MIDNGFLSCGASLCSRCATLGKTCCQGTVIALTGGDVARITAFTGADDFLHLLPLEQDISHPDWDPLYAKLLRPGRRRYLLRHRPDGDCHFLAAAGCVLPLSVRPLICRLYPFEYDHVAIKGVNGHLCPEPERDNGPLLLALLAMNRDRAEEWREGLYGEIEDS